MAQSSRKPTRSQTFRPGRQPLQNHESLKPNPAKIHGPFSFLNPTRAHFNHEETSHDDSADSDHAGREQAADNVEFRWTSRNNRKGRHQIDVTLADDTSTGKYLVPESTDSLREIMKNIGRMFTKYPYWDVSWLVAYIFTWGSIIWVINSFFVFLPLVRPSTQFPNESLTAGGITAFIGATVFEVGSVLLMLEAVNENTTGCFGWAVEQVISKTEKDSGQLLRVTPDSCIHHHRNRKNLLGLSAQQPSDEESSSEKQQRCHSVPQDTQRSWTWFPSFHELRTHYLYQLGFLACLAQFFGATVFWVSGFTALPGILNNLSHAAENWAFWLPQVIGGSGFIVSGILFMVETQEKWYKPAPLVLGWHVGAWNFIGGVGFTLCPAFGFDTASWAQFQSSCSTFWGSWAFLIGSVFQLYESLQKHPVKVVKAPKGAGRTPKGTDQNADFSDMPETSSA